jgi:hypothetical protein
MGSGGGEAQMAMSAGGEQLIRQSMQELQEAQLEVLAAHARVDAKLLEVEGNLNQVRQDFASLSRFMAAAVQSIQEATLIRETTLEMGQSVSLPGDATKEMNRQVDAISKSATKTPYEVFFEKLGRTLNMLIEQQEQDRLVLADHERRLTLLEQA